MKLKVVVDDYDTRFFEGDKIIAIDTQDGKLVVKKSSNHVEGIIAVFRHWCYYEFMDENSQTTNDPLRVTWKALLKSMSEELTNKLKNSIIGSEIIDVDIQGRTRIVLRTDAKPVRYGNVIYDTSRIIVKS